MQLGSLGPLPEGADWQELAACHGQSVLLKLTLISLEGFCLATLAAADRLAYARGRKEAGGRFFKRSCFASALERYSLAAELLSYVEDLKDGSLISEAKELRLMCELNAIVCLLKLQKWREAETVSCSVLKQRPDNEKALFCRARALLEQGDAARAGIDLRKVLNINPENHAAKQLLDRTRRFKYRYC